MKFIKKRVILFFGSCIIVLGLGIGGVALAVNGLPQGENDTSLNKEKTENLVPEFINIDDCHSYSSEADKSAAADNFIADMLSLEVEKLAGISDCIIDITGLNGESLGADVCITINNSFDNAIEANIRADIAQALDISVENVRISYK